MRGRPGEFSKRDAMLHIAGTLPLKFKTKSQDVAQAFSKGSLGNLRSNSGSIANKTPSVRRVHTKMSFARITLRSLSRSRPTFAVSKQSAYRLHRANFSAAAGLSKGDIQTRIFDVLKGFEKIEHSKVHFQCIHRSMSFFPDYLHIFQISTLASFAGDLSLDSLDAVEVVMAIEEVRVVPVPPT